MSWRFNRRREDKDDEDDSERKDSYQDPFSFGFGSGFQDFDRMIESMLKTMGPNSNSNSAFYGYSVNVGPDGKPHVRQFGNVTPTPNGPLELGSREPFVDVVANDKDQTVKVVAEMPGVQKENIELDTTEDTLTIKTTKTDRKYNTTVPLKPAVDPSSAKASYRNGVLEVVLRMKEAPKPKGTSIQID